MILKDAHWMNCAVEQAKISAQHDEVPVGAVLVKDNELVASGHNQSITLRRPTAHAEILVLERAARKLNNYRLTGTTLYVTLEPCLMCLGAMLTARIDRLVFGAFEPNTGAVCSRHALLEDPLLAARLDWLGGVLSDQAATLMEEFFTSKR